MKYKFLLKVWSTSIVFSAILFISAGKINYFQGWLFFANTMITGFMNFWSIRNNEELMNERTVIGENAKSWDKKILGWSLLVYIVNIILVGLDSGRFCWSPDFKIRIYVIGMILSFVGQIIFLTARTQNQFFSSVVRIQTDRGHTMCDTGLYKIVRHPGYVGMILSLLAVPIFTGSLWSFITTGIAVVLIIIRTQLEDETLKKELSGYEAYSKMTRYKLIPGVW